MPKPKEIVADFNVKLVKKAFCNYCKKYTDHEVRSRPNKEGTGGDLRCTGCGSARMDTIQGFNANLM